MGKPSDGLRLRALQCRRLIIGSTRKSSTMKAFSTGDVATVDEHGYMRITDRSKDMIKSGGEWISSIELENLAVSETVALQARFQLAVTPSLSAAGQHAACPLASERSTNLPRKWRDTFIRERRF